MIQASTIHGSTLQGSLENPTGTVTIAGDALSYGVTQFDRMFVKANIEDKKLHNP